MAGLSNRVRGVMGLAAALLIAACGAQQPIAESTPAAAPTMATSTPAAMATPSASPMSAATPPAAATAAAASASPAGSVLEVATSPEHGDYLAVDGRALYIFTPDPTGSSSCFDECVDNWPPLAAPVIAGAGVDGTIGEFQRTDDASRQVTHNGAPLYFFIADTAPGDTSGEGVGDVWFLARPAPASSPGGSGADDEPTFDYEY